MGFILGGFAVVVIESLVICLMFMNLRRDGLSPLILTLLCAPLISVLAALIVLLILSFGVNSYAAAFGAGFAILAVASIFTLVINAFLTVFVYKSLSKQVGNKKEAGPGYNWVCQACETVNPGNVERCNNCNCPAEATQREIARYASSNN
ncbi:hypothetical protein [Pleionea sediminis]|uniref:hypothetical protein n=1 Tax=Pleionea sediminis TaxID=2569479 RepID=UPI001186E866|nr:hypothetical protein [Pleionea sediminis]